MIKKLTAALALTFVFAVQANAASMTIVAPDEAMIGEQFQVTILGDFTGEGLIAGGVTFFYDAALVRLDGVTLNLAVTPDFSCPGSTNCPADGPNSTTIVWGEFLNNLIEVDDPAPTLMATLDFTAISATAETLAVFTMQSSDDLTGGWFGAGFSSIPSPSFGDASTNVVPLPAAVWFMIGGLGTLLGFRRK